MRIYGCTNATSQIFKSQHASSKNEVKCLWSFEVLREYSKTLTLKYSLNCRKCYQFCWNKNGLQQKKNWRIKGKIKRLTFIISVHLLIVSTFLIYFRENYFLKLFNVTYYLSLLDITKQDISMYRENLK